MSNQQKSAWYRLTVALVALLAYVALRLALNAEVAVAAMSVLAVIALEPMLFPPEAPDERERLIATRAGLAGGMAAYLYLFAICFLVWGSHFRADPPTVDVNILPLIAMGAAVALLAVHSIAVLVLHRRDLDVGGA